MAVGIYDLASGLAIGVMGTILASYRYFQSASECGARRQECIERMHREIAEMKEAMKCLKDELASQRRLLMTIIIYLPIPDEQRRELLDREGKR